MERHLVEFIFAKGVDTKTDAKLVAPGSLLLLENGRFTKAGTITKRNGHAPLARKIFGQTSRILSALAIAKLGDETLLADRTGELYSWAPALGAWVDKGAVSPVSVRSRPLVRNTYQQSNPDAATRNGVTVYAWTDTRGGVFADVVDETSGAKILADVQLSTTGARPRVVAVDTAILVVYLEGANVKCRAIQVTTPTAFAVAQLLATDSATTPANQHIDACASSIAEAAFFAYATGGGSIKVGYIRRNGSVGDPGNGGYPSLVTIAQSADFALAIALEPASRAIFLFYSTGTALRASALFDDLTVKNASSLVETIANVMNVAPALVDGVWTVFYEIFATRTYNRLVKVANVSLAGVASDVEVLQRSVGLASKAFVQEGRAHVAIVHDATTDTQTPPPAPFTPDTLAGLKLWLKADAGTFSDAAGTVASVSGGEVRHWKDQSAHLSNFTKGGNPNGPAYTAPDVHSLPSLDVSTWPLLRGDAGGLDNAAASIFTVVVAGGSGTSESVLSCYPNGFALGVSDSVANKLKFFYGAGTREGGALVAGAQSIVHASYDGAATFLYQDNVQVDTGGAAAPSFAGATATVGKLSGGAQEFQGKILEVLVYDTVLSAPDRAKVCAYLKARWGTP